MAWVVYFEGGENITVLLSSLLTKHLMTTYICLLILVQVYKAMGPTRRQSTILSLFEDPDIPSAPLPNRCWWSY